MLGGAELEVYSEVELGDGGESVAEDVGNTSETLEEVVSLDEADHNDSNEAARKAALTVYTNNELEDAYETNIRGCFDNGRGETANDIVFTILILS